LPIMVGGALLLFLIVFGIGLGLRLVWPGLTGDKAVGSEDGVKSTRLSFATLYTGPGDYSLLKVNVYFSSSDVAALVRSEHRLQAIRTLRRTLDQFFRTAGAAAFSRVSEALQPSRRTRERIRNAFEAQIRELSPELKQQEGPLLQAVTIYFIEGEG